MTDAVQFVEGDTGSVLRLTLKDDKTKQVIDLTGATVDLRWRNKNNTATESKTMTVVDAVNGVVEYKFLANELFPPAMLFEVRITDSGGYVTHSLELLREAVRAALA